MGGAVHSSSLGRLVDFTSASLFAGATGYSALMVTASTVGAAGLAVAGFLGASVAMSRIKDTSHFPLPQFPVTDVDPDELPELLLTELPELLLTERTELLLTDKLEGANDELLLVDRLEQPAQDSRVIRLFDPRTLPTAGELHKRIERHLRSEQDAAYPDATAELHQALAALRGSLR
jgi:hypothetical protein